MTKTYLLVAALAFAFGGGAMAQQVPIINGDHLTCSQWVADHTAPNRNETIAAMQSGYILGLSDALSKTVGKADLEPAKYDSFLTSITRYCQQNPTELVTTAAGFVDGAFEFHRAYQNQIR